MPPVSSVPGKDVVRAPAMTAAASTHSAVAPWLWLLRIHETPNGLSLAMSERYAEPRRDSARIFETGADLRR
jgi:hypothetical protein